MERMLVYIEGKVKVRISRGKYITMTHDEFDRRLREKFISLIVTGKQIGRAHV